jgi:hypothetical protein
VCGDSLTGGFDTDCLYLNTRVLRIQARGRMLRKGDAVRPICCLSAASELVEGDPAMRPVPVPRLVHHPPTTHPTTVRLWRFILGLTLIGGLMAVPATVSADPLVRFSEHGVALFCDAFSEEDGELHLFAVTSSEFGDFAELVASAAPVDPESPPDISGTTEEVTVVEAGGGATMNVTIPLVDPDGASVGDALVSATLTPTGETITLEPFRDGNRWIKTTGTIFPQEVTGTLDLPGDLPDFSLEDLGCGGEIFDVDVFETQPSAFVASNQGVLVDCAWESDGMFAHLFAVSDSFGMYAEASLFVDGEHDFFGSTEDLSLDATGLAVDIELFDFLNEEPGSASADATLTPEGDWVKSNVVSQNAHDRLMERMLTPDGTITYSTGDEFPVDSEHCFAIEFDNRLFGQPAGGPKPDGKAPANDTPDGAIALSLGASRNDQTGGAALDAELDPATCPDPDDGMGRTLWYSFTGTGDPVTVDTAGSNFDTVLAVYDEDLTELACVDDVEFDPLGFTFQSAVTIDTVEGETYYVQAGGYRSTFERGEAQFGRLRIGIE